VSFVCAETDNHEVGMLGIDFAQHIAAGEFRGTGSVDAYEVESHVEIAFKRLLDGLREGVATNLAVANLKYSD
jgi:hypothetical protein